MGEIAREYGVIDAFIYDSGVVAITTNFKIISITSFADPRPTALDVTLTEIPHCWTVVPPENSLSRHVEVVLAVKETIIVVDFVQSQDQV